jgi:cellulose synthase/poly-beta-1,6-N-acetylglucosamine synthase-like glycosyltransferase
MSGIEIAVLTAYFSVLAVLSLYGVHRYHLVYLYLKHRHQAPRPQSRFMELPAVTVQLPLYNEMYVAERLIRAVCAIDYPRHLLEIQVLDDSTDRTTAIVETVVEELRALGHDIHHVRRPNRAGFKAGALAHGLHTARGQFVAIFDADFVPQHDFLERSIHFFTDPNVGMVQARWGHLNRDYSLLTRVQSIFLDGHFIIEHTARNRSGRFFNFNGTAGVWRRACIEAAGGWQHDTLTEDLDLSYRAQLGGWKFVFLPEVVSPAELPVDMNAFKSQQHRWAKGSIQTGRKLLREIWGSRLPLKVKMEAFFHLTSNGAYVLMIALAVLMFPSLLIRRHLEWTHFLWIDLLLFASATLSISIFYLCSQREAQRSWLGALKYLPLLMALGIGLSVNNARAVVEALFNRESEFTRTPKYGVVRRGPRAGAWLYRGRRSLFTLAEAALAAYFVAAAVYCLFQQMYVSLPFLMLFVGGYLYTSSLSVAQQWGPVEPQRR